MFALDEIDLGAECRVHDLPTGSWRYSRKPAGYRATVVNGVPHLGQRRVPPPPAPATSLRNAAVS